MACTELTEPFYKGRTKLFGYRCKVNGVNEDITGDTVTLTIRKAMNATPIIEISNTVHTDPTNGYGEFDLSAEDTSALPLGRVYVGMTWLRANGDKHELLKATPDILQPVGA